MGASLNRVAFSATVHCLSGCATGEVLGMVIGTAAALSNLATTLLSIALAFLFGYAFTSVPLLRAGMALGAVVPVAALADGPRAQLDAGLGDILFWGSLAVALLIAGVVAYPANRALIARGKGHAVAHGHHG